MTINLTDLKWRQSQRLTDNDDGGGRMTGTEVVDGQVNNLLPDIGRIDRAAGRVNLRKEFAHVSTGNTDVFTNAHAAVMARPADPNVEVLLFQTTDQNDERADAQERIERYLGLGIDTGALLFGDHYDGQRTVTLMQGKSLPLPIVGDTIVLKVPATGATEYVRISDISSEVRSFTTYENGAERNFKRRLVTLTLFAPLLSDYVGEQPSYFPSGTIETRVYTSIVADAAQYYGIAQLTAAAAPGDQSITVDSIFKRVVPATEGEIPLLDQRATADLSQYLQAGEAYTITRVGTVDTPLYEGYFDRPVRPGSATVTLKISTTTRQELRDDGAGNLAAFVGGVNSTTPSVVFGTIDYASGRVQLQFSASFGNSNWSLLIEAQPAGLVSEAGFTAHETVTLANRGFTWLKTMTPAPAPGFLTFSFRSLGRWYTLRDNGRGQLSSGISAEGAGTIDYSTGTAAATTGYLPDVDTDVLWTWGTQADVARLDGADTETPAVRVVIDLANGIEPGTAGNVSIDYIAGGVTYTVTDDGAGAISGDGAGFVRYGDGHVEFVPDHLPDKGTNASITFQAIDSESMTISSPTVNVDDQIEIALGEAIAAGTVSLFVPLTVTQGGQQQVRYFNYIDDGAGTLNRLEYRNDGSGNYRYVVVAEDSGSVNYATGAIVVETVLTIPAYSWDGTSWSEADATTALATGDVTANWQVSGGATETSETSAINSLSGNFIGGYSRSLIANSARITLGGQTIVARDGGLVRAVSAATNAGTACGSIDGAGTYTITDWTGGGANTISVSAGLAYYGHATIAALAFRIPVQSVRSQSLTVTATTPSGSVSTAISDAGGNVNGGIITGTIDYKSGLVVLAFSTPVRGETILYSAVGIKYVPLSEDIIKLDPVRLPQDGRVPIFRSANLVVIHNTADEQLDAPLSAGDVATLSRGPINKLWLADDNGVTIPPELYTADMASTPATITFADPLDLSAYQQPLVATTRVEQTRLVDEAQIGGVITLLNPLTANFPANTSYVSTILLFGEMQGRVEHLFTQKTWGNVWSDARIGDDSIASYNDVVYPLVIVNRNAITERWAIVFTSTSDFYVLGEFSGVIATGAIGADCAPINPYTAEPYFTIPKEGWGSGWVNSNVLRFNTVGAYAPVWVIRSIQAGEATVVSDQGRIEFRGDAD